MSTAEEDYGWGASEDFESLDTCSNPECNQVEPEWSPDGRCMTCGEEDENRAEDRDVIAQKFINDGRFSPLRTKLYLGVYEPPSDLLHHQDWLLIISRCPDCGRESYIYVKRDGFDDWLKGALIQRVLPTLTDSEREMLMTGICPLCWENLFREEGSA